jgi:hypothetical protein
MNLEQVAREAEQLKTRYENGEITASEFKEMVDDLGALQAIEDSSAFLEKNIACRQLIVNVINIASAIV